MSLATLKNQLILQAEFPTMDLENIEETLQACDGDVSKCAIILRDVLEEEAAEAGAEAAPATGKKSILHALLDAVSTLCMLPADEHPPGSRERVVAACGGLKSTGIHLSRPVEMLLDGERDAATLTADLDEADGEVMRQLLRIVVTGASSLPRSTLTKQEMASLAAEFGASAERDDLEARLTVSLEDLEKKGQGLELLQQAVTQKQSQHVGRLAAEVAA